MGVLLTPLILPASAVIAKTCFDSHFPRPLGATKQLNPIGFQRKFKVYIFVSKEGGISIRLFKLKNND